MSPEPFFFMLRGIMKYQAMPMAGTDWRRLRSRVFGEISLRDNAPLRLPF